MIDIDVNVAVNAAAEEILEANHCVGEKGSGSRMRVDMVLMRGTVLATTSFHSGSNQVFSRHFLRSSRLE